jgi:peptidylprolyl isomerase
MHAKPSIAALMLALLSIPASRPLQARPAWHESDRIRRSKIASLLRLQDIRAPFDAGLSAYLSDGDPVVRARAALACGSLQDTSAIGPLTLALNDPDSSTEEAAAFALGQTGVRLSEPGRRSLEENLIGTHVPYTRAAGRLVEEIGKFGTASGLNELLAAATARTPFRHPVQMMMSVARFALRGISSAAAVRYLIDCVRPDVPGPWQAVYALQRTGDSPVSRSNIGLLCRLERDSDPLVRMNLATLLGKLHGAAGASETLCRLAAIDSDWRVRVNALKALGQFHEHGNPEMLGVVLRSFSDRNPHIAITALAVFPDVSAGSADTSAGSREALGLVRAIAENRSGDFPWQLQAEAATAVAKIERRIPSALLRSETIAPEKLRARLMTAAGQSGDSAACAFLSRAASGQNPLFATAALEGLRLLALENPGNTPLADSASGAAIRSLRIHDMAVVSTAAGILGDSLFRRGNAVEPLLNALGEFGGPGDAETLQDVIRALGTIRDPRAVTPLESFLASPVSAVSRAAADALGMITGRDYGGRIVRSSNPPREEPDTAYLASLPSVIRGTVTTSRGDILIDLETDAAPFTVMTIVKLCRSGFYRGLPFHRVVPNFVVQGGDPRGDGWGGPGYAIRSEFSMEAYGTGTVGIASAGKDTEGSQFFITHSPQPHLDGRYTVVGRVVAGMEVVDALQAEDTIFDFTLVR